MSGPDPNKVYIATDAFSTEIDGREVVIAKGMPRMGDEQVVIRTFPNLWIEAEQDPETRAKRRLAETLGLPIELPEPSPATKPRRRGRPLYSDDDLRAARQALREAGMPETQAEAEILLGWDRKTIQAHWEKSSVE